MSGMWKRSHGRTSEAPPDERGGYRYVRPTVTAPHLDSTQLSRWAALTDADRARTDARRRSRAPGRWTSAPPAKRLDGDGFRAAFPIPLPLTIVPQRHIRRG